MPTCGFFKPLLKKLMPSISPAGAAMRRALLDLAVVDSAERIYRIILQLAEQN